MLIDSNTKTKEGLTIQARLDEKQYEKGIKIFDEELSKVNLQTDEFHSKWNYPICPN